MKYFLTINYLTIEPSNHRTLTPLPKRRLSTRRQTQRAKGLKKVGFKQFFTCKNCGATALPHHVCKKCGQYDGKQIINVKTKSSKSNK